MDKEIIYPKYLPCLDEHGNMTRAQLPWNEDYPLNLNAAIETYEIEGRGKGFVFEIGETDRLTYDTVRSWKGKKAVLDSQIHRIIGIETHCMLDNILMSKGTRFSALVGPPMSQEDMTKSP